MYATKKTKKFVLINPLKIHGLLVNLIHVSQMNEISNRQTLAVKYGYNSEMKKKF